MKLSLLSVLLLHLVTSSSSTSEPVTSCCPETSVVATEDSLLISSFNIQVFGQSKVGKENVVEVLVKILSRYDLIMIQEIRDSKKTAFPRLIEMLNEATNDSFEFETGKRVGRTSSKEQYGFVYRTSKLEVRNMYQFSDDYEVFEREPLVVRFRRIDNLGRQREFTFIPLHAKPSDAVAEMNHLIPVYEESTRYYGPIVTVGYGMGGLPLSFGRPSIPVSILNGGVFAFFISPLKFNIDPPTVAITVLAFSHLRFRAENFRDAIIAGDFNADCTYVCKSCWDDVTLRSDNRFKWLIADDVDTTTYNTDCAYDRIILAGKSLQENSCCATVFRFDLEYNLDVELTKEVSDHYPVQFTIP